MPGNVIVDLRRTYSAPSWSKSASSGKWLIWEHTPLFTPGRREKKNRGVTRHNKRQPLITDAVRTKRAQQISSWETNWLTLEHSHIFVRISLFCIQAFEPDVRPQHTDNNTTEVKCKLVTSHTHTSVNFVGLAHHVKSTYRWAIYQNYIVIWDYISSFPSFKACITVKWYHFMNLPEFWSCT